MNYLWFSKNYDKFLYIDRVVVSEKYQVMGIGKLIYNEVFSHAKNTGIDKVTAEIDIKPENPVSLKFHERFGFKEVGKLNFRRIWQPYSIKKVNQVSAFTTSLNQTT